MAAQLQTHGYCERGAYVICNLHASPRCAWRVRSLIVGKYEQGMASRAERDMVGEGGRVLDTDDSHLEAVSPQSVTTSVRVRAGSQIRAGEPRERGGFNDNQERLMSAFSIDFDGRCYRYRGYRYGRLQDAVAYAELMASRQSTETAFDPLRPYDHVRPPSERDRTIMAAWSISFDAGVYRYGEYRYDRLADAVNYARIDAARLC
ncbi:MAG TPA: hypothetical protein VNG69_07400 [Casimicrobiaceae bacterium]|nr:hypothetical protein [Casimicrobiaceae bacterium]